MWSEILLLKGLRFKKEKRLIELFKYRKLWFVDDTNRAGRAYWTGNEALRFTEIFPSRGSPFALQSSHRIQKFCVSPDHCSNASCF
jgi:hypothetical protein